MNEQTPQADSPTGSTGHGAALHSGATAGAMRDPIGSAVSGATRDSAVETILDRLALVEAQPLTRRAEPYQRIAAELQAELEGDE